MGIMTNPPPIPANDPKAPATLPINTDWDATFHNGCEATYEVVVEVVVVVLVAEEDSTDDDDAAEEGFVELLLELVVRR
jgi:hypothetical protein